jgi:hypothetical protein
VSVFVFVFEGGWRERVAAGGDEETPRPRAARFRIVPD